MKEFREFWEDYRGTFSEHINGSQIEEIAEQIAFAAWRKGQRHAGSPSEFDAKANAFPTILDAPIQELTKREYLAAKALQGLLASAPGLTEAIALGNIEIVQEHAQAAVLSADALIKALNKK